MFKPGFHSILSNTRALAFLQNRLLKAHMSYSCINIYDLDFGSSKKHMKTNTS